jgi:dephospho-CoA kinase
MLKVGITGGIGSGKSYICDVFKKIGIPVYEADEKARIITNTTDQVKSEIINVFGLQAYNNNLLNTKFIASSVFNNPGLLEQLNSIIHPAVENDFISWCQEQKNQAYIIKEAAILFETGIYKKLNRNILVLAPEHIRVKRVQSRDNSTEIEIRNRIKNQWPTEKTVQLADFIIENDGKKLILPQIIKIDKEIRNEWQNLANG